MHPTKTDVYIYITSIYNVYKYCVRNYTFILQLDNHGNQLFSLRKNPKQFKFKTARNRHEKKRPHRINWKRMPLLRGKKSTGWTIVRTYQNSTVSAYSENCFEINVYIFPLKQDESVLSIFQSKGKFSNVMYSNLFDNRLSHNSNFKSYARKFQCKSCKHHFEIVLIHKMSPTCLCGKDKEEIPWWSLLQTLVSIW